MLAPEDVLLHEWLRRSAEKFPSSPALVEDEKSTTFCELFQNAAALSQALRRRGLEKGDRVALVQPKSTEAITSAYAVLMAGAIYVPIQPRWPAEKREATLRDCSPRFVLQQGANGPLVLDANGAQLPWRELLAESGDSCSEPDVAPDDPAFILFTSGSTGEPRGVVISHRAVAAFVQWSAGEFALGTHDRIACPSPLSFDLSTFDIFNMALVGATCVLVPDDIVWMPRFLTAFVHDRGITVWYSVPSILTGMLNEGRFAAGSYPDLRAVLFAGEVFAPGNAAKLQAAVPHALCANLYGPTETNVITWHRLPSDRDPAQPIPIGRVCPYAEVIVDPANGELLAAGQSVMSGYWNQPAETERAFATIHRKRFYRTGDRVATNAGGDYLYVGRLDRQVKRRGFRIELGEIEAALGLHPAVAEAAVIACQNAGTDTTITAFVRVRAHCSVSWVDLKMHCAQFLPASAMPDRIVFLNAVPRGSRGKIDYEALKQLCAEERDHGYPGGGPPVHN